MAARHTSHVDVSKGLASPLIDCLRYHRPVALAGVAARAGRRIARPPGSDHQRYTRSPTLRRRTRSLSGPRATRFHHLNTRCPTTPTTGRPRTAPLRQLRDVPCKLNRHSSSTRFPAPSAPGEAPRRGGSWRSSAAADRGRHRHDDPRKTRGGDIDAACGPARGGACAIGSRCAGLPTRIPVVRRDERVNTMGTRQMEAR